MHMADALLSPVVGGIMTVASGSAIAYSAKKISDVELDEKKIPMMGVAGAFVFAAQMINFTIPGTGSSGHLSGGILLAALLGPFPALLTIASVLLIQCLFFADGGLLAYGCNVFNIGVCACLFAYPLIYKPIIRKSKNNIILASVISAVVTLQIGAFFVVLQTLMSGVVGIQFKTFLLLMQPIHLAIGLVEGVVTAAVLSFVHNAQPGILDSSLNDTPINISAKRISVILLIITLITGGFLSLFASSLPDGLEWSLEKAFGSDELEANGSIYEAMEAIVDSTSIMPDYSFSNEDASSSLGTATAGIIGSAITILIAGGAGFFIRLIKKKAALKTG